MFKRKQLFLISILLFLPLIGICQIDVPKWVDDIGGPSSNCISSSVQVDKQNNVYVTGFFNGTADFDPSSAVYNLTATGTFDTFVAKYTTDGKFVWAIDMGGGGGYTQVNSLAVDASGDPIICGQFNSTLNVGSTTLTSQGDYDAFLIKFNTNGQLVWAKDIGGGETDYGSQVDADSQGNVITCLRYESTITIGGSSFSPGGGTFNGLCLKFDPNGNFMWGVNIADPGDSEAFSAIDPQDNVVIGGHFQGNDNFNPLGTAYDLNGNGDSEFASKYTPAGILIWVQDFKGVLAGNNINICSDSQGDVFADGPFQSMLTFNGTTLSPTGHEDLFLVKYSSTGVFQSVKDIGGANASIFNYGIHSSQDNNIFISGYFSGTVDFDPSPATTALVSYHGMQDFFLAKYDNNLNYKWAFSGGSPDCSQSLGRNTAIDNNNDVLFTGGFCSTVNFSASSCSPYNLTAQSTSRDCFLGKYTQNTATDTAQITGFTVPQQVGPTTIDQTNLIITVTVPAGTDITALVPTVTYSSDATLSPASGTAENFTSGATYKLTANCATLNYTVNVIFATQATDLTTCSGNTESLTGATENPIPDSYLWQVFQNNTWISASGTINTANYQTAALVNTKNANTIIDYRRQITTSGVVNYDSYYDITVQPALAGNTITAPADSVFCSSGTPSAITGSTPTGGTGTYTYQWQSSTDDKTFTNINGATAVNYSPNALTVTTYYQRIVSSGTCSISISNITRIVITPPPPAPASITQQTCSGSSATLTLTDAQTGLTYNWYDSAAKTNLLFTGTSYVTPALTNNTTYYIEAFSGTCPASALATAQVTIIALPSAPAVNSGNVTTCPGSTVTLSIANAQTGFTYNWYTSATGGTAAGTGIDFVTPALSTNTIYYAEAVNATGCISATRTPVNITISTPPDVSATGADACPNTSAVLSAQSLDVNATINWYASATGGTILYTGGTFNTPDLGTTTSYYAEAVDHTTGCVSSQRAVATVNILTQLAAPVVTVESTSSTQITFQWSAVTGASAYQVSIDNGATFTDPSSGTDGLSTTISNLQQNQSVTIIVKALGSYSCQSSATSTAVTAIAQNPQSDIIYVANAFTPNGDGINDVVYVHGTGIQSMTFRVYDQFGELIFSSGSQSIGWDGTYKGTKQPVGVYVYYVQAVMYNGEKINKKGTITLLR